MSTYRDVITQALEELGVLHVGETPSGDDVNDCFKRLNQMLHSWALSGIDLEFTTATNIDSDVPYPEDHIGPFAANLAMRLAPAYGVSVSPELVALAEIGYRQVQNANLKMRNLAVDKGLTFGMPNW